MTYHEQTTHTYQSVRSGGRYINWDTQPSAFKHYPHFYSRIKLDRDNPTHRLILYSGMITFQKQYGAHSVNLRINPSAGALYPNELYLQIRNVSGFDNGIYHFDILHSELVFIQAIGYDGVEHYFHDQNRIDGIIFLISSPYFRSSWKYGDRAFRYCLLDSGHLLGSIEASCTLQQKPYSFFFDFDKATLNKAFGFENKEFFTCGAIIGERFEQPIRALGEPLPIVAPADYFEQNTLVEEAYVQSLQESHQYRDSIPSPVWNYDKEKLEKAILSRRSIREFSARAMQKEEYDFIMTQVQQPIPSPTAESIHTHTVINRIENMNPGYYLDSKCQKEGDFAYKAGYLCLEQALGMQSGMTLFLSSDFTNYQTALIHAGIIGHRFYLASNYLGIGCSGIGAYYDSDVQEFLETQESILYALAVGY